MNALVIIDTDALTPATVFAPGGVEGIISKLETDVRAIEQDISTEEGRKAVKSLAYKIARSKTALDEMGKELVADIKAKAGAIDAERRIIRDRLDALKDEVSGPLTAWESRETARVSEHEDALVWLAQCDRFATPPTAAMIIAQLLDVAAAGRRDWQEFKERGDVAVTDATAKLDAMLDVAEQAERDQAELAELRAARAKREADDAAAAQAKAQADRAAQDAEAFAASERIRIEQQAKRDQERAEQAEADKIRAAAEAVEQERLRVARAKEDADRATAKREANKKHRAKVHCEIEAALLRCGFEEVNAQRIVEALSDGLIPHVRIEY